MHGDPLNRTQAAWAYSIIRFPWLHIHWMMLVIPRRDGYGLLWQNVGDKSQYGSPLPIKILNDVITSWASINPMGRSHSLCETSCWNDVNTLRPRQNGRLFADDIFKYISVNENVWISIEMSLKFVPKGAISNIPALVQKMAWRRQTIIWTQMTISLTDICATRPQWVNCSYLRPLSHRVLKKLLCNHRRGSWWRATIRRLGICSSNAPSYDQAGAVYTYHPTEYRGSVAQVSSSKLAQIYGYWYIGDCSNALIVLCDKHMNLHGMTPNCI